jgi:inorganic pyrophosphatase
MENISETPISVYIEIEKGSNFKYEFNKQTNQLELDRILTEPHVYPYAYGFIPHTLAEDGDELDVLVVTENATPIKNDSYIEAYIVGALLMEDEHGNDHKVLVIPKTEYETGIIQSLYDMSAETLESIQTFFANYKKNEPDKWSIVGGFVGKSSAMQLYKKSVLSNSTNELEDEEGGFSAQTDAHYAHTSSH